MTFSEWQTKTNFFHWKTSCCFPNPTFSDFISAEVGNGSVGIHPIQETWSFAKKNTWLRAKLKDAGKMLHPWKPFCTILNLFQLASDGTSWHIKPEKVSRWSASICLPIEVSPNPMVYCHLNWNFRIDCTVSHLPTQAYIINCHQASSNIINQLSSSIMKCHEISSNDHQLSYFWWSFIPLDHLRSPEIPTKNTTSPRCQERRRPFHQQQLHGVAVRRATGHAESWGSFSADVVLISWWFHRDSTRKNIGIEWDWMDLRCENWRFPIYKEMDGIKKTQKQKVSENRTHKNN